MGSKVVRSTSKGQITLPKEWRERVKTDNFLLQMNVGYIVIRPLDLDALEDETIIFDADRDNAGKGVTPEEMIKLLKQIRKS